jgi:alpha-D-xyloside xylohydrolase
VTTYRARSRTVQLPAVPGGWYEFWTGKSVGGGKAVDAPAPYDEMPLHVRAGAILPVGPELQYADEKPAEPLTLRVYAGADGDFCLYEDDGASYGYERGEFTRIPLHWDDAKQTLTIGARTGAFTGMLAERTIHIVVTRPGKPVAFAFDAAPDRTVRYDGKPLDVKLAP